MKMAFRWFGEGNDNIPLEYIKQIPRTKEVVWALHHKNPGEVWSLDEIKSETDYIFKSGLEASVVESVNIHDDIKLGLATRDTYIENYKKTLINLSKQGVKVVCYNFMPIFDWVRTDLFHPLEDGSTAMYLDKNEVLDISPQELIKKFEEGSKDLTLPGWEPERMAKIKKLFKQYKGLTYEDLLANFKYFIDAIIPTCEKHDILMALHPDDPPFEIFGLPRLVNNEENIDNILSVNNSKHHGLTFCTGSLGVNPNNDLKYMIKKYIKRIHFMHIRNINIKSNNILEVSHLASDGLIDTVGIMKVLVEYNYNGFIRPDHGRHIFGENKENVRPGYGLYDRALGIMYLNGSLDTIKQSINN